MQLGLPFLATPEAQDAPPADATLEWLRSLASESTPIAELIANANTYLLHLDQHYPDDAVLWTGVERLAHAVVADEQLQQRRRLAQLLLAVASSHATSTLDAALLAELGKVR